LRRRPFFVPLFRPARERVMSSTMRGLALLFLLPLTGCGAGDNDPGPGGVTVGEARALDEAAAMIEERRSPVEDVSPQPAMELQPTPTAS
jgi:hypothetical protein